MGSWAWWRSWFLIFFGCSVMGAGFVLFVNPYNFVPGGVYGMGIVLHNIFPSIQVGTFGYMFDVPLMLVAMLVFGGQFGTRTVLAALYTPGFMNVLTRLVYPDAAAVESLDPSLLLNGRLDLSNDLLLTCVIGAVVIGVGQGIVVRQQATTGGTDIVAMLLQKFAGIKFSSGIFLADGFVVLSGLAVIGFGLGTGEAASNGWMLTLYSLITIYITSRVIAYLLNGASYDKLLFIISDHHQALKRFIIEDLDRNGVSAYVAIMRGCNNFCSYCVVPYTRGRERSRDPQTIVAEARSLFENGYREVTLLGQNVNSYKAGEVDFPELMRLVASVSPSLRVRFATSHPKDMSDRLLEVMASMPNICRAIHLPAQSGASSMLGRMNRKYTREWYLGRIAAIRRYLPDCAITTDLIAGFSGETEQEHEATLSLMREVGYEFAYMFKYSERPGTFAHEHLPDDVPDEVKSRRLSEIIALQNELGHASNLRDVGREFEVLVEGRSKRDEKQLSGRTSQNKVVVFDRGRHDVGDYVRVRITGCTPATLFGEEII